MKFYFDESGGFAVPKEATAHDVGIVVGVDIPETVERQVFDEYDKFTSRLSSDELKNGEPKGNLLSQSSRYRFSQMMFGFEHVFVTVAILDLTTLAGNSEINVQKLLVAKLRHLAGRCVHETLREETELLTRRFANLHISQALRFASWARCIHKTLHHSVIFRSGEQFSDCWDILRFEVDPVQQNPQSRERLIFQWMLLGWLTAWSAGDPFMLIDEIHTEDHPFVQKYETENGIDLREIVKGNLFWPSSADSRGLQIADMCATVVSKAVRGIADMDNLKDYGRVMSRCVLAPQFAPGIFTLGDVDQNDIARRYAGLVGAIQRART